jgi:hypothetical protein
MEQVREYLETTAAEFLEATKESKQLEGRRTAVDKELYDLSRELNENEMAWAACRDESTKVQLNNCILKHMEAYEKYVECDIDESRSIGRVKKASYELTTAETLWSKYKPGNNV